MAIANTPLRVVQTRLFLLSTDLNPCIPWDKFVTCEEIPMAVKLYVGNLAYSVGDSELQQMFIPFGKVTSAQVIKDRDNGRSKGFGFVELGTSEEGKAAITAMNGKDVDGRALVVNEARPKEESGGGGRGGFGGAGRGGDRDRGGDRGGYGGGRGR
jgi:RNA recognition motif-containing protein